MSKGVKVRLVDEGAGTETLLLCRDVFVIEDEERRDRTGVC